MLVTLPCENGRKERKIQMTKGTIQSVKRKKQKSNGNPGWQDRRNVTDINNPFYFKPKNVIKLIAEDAIAGVHFCVKILQPP